MNPGAWHGYAMHTGLTTMHPTMTYPVAATLHPGMTNLMNSLMVPDYMPSMQGMAFQPPLSSCSCNVVIFDDKIVYPDIESFFLELSEKKPKRNFGSLVQQLIGDDFFHIDELADQKEAWFTEEPYHQSHGNASFIVQAVRDKLARIRQEA